MSLITSTCAFFLLLLIICSFFFFFFSRDTHKGCSHVFPLLPNTSFFFSISFNCEIQASFLAISGHLTAHVCMCVCVCGRRGGVNVPRGLRSVEWVTSSYERCAQRCFFPHIRMLLCLIGRSAWQEIGQEVQRESGGKKKESTEVVQFLISEAECRRECFTKAVMAPLRAA